MEESYMICISKEENILKTLNLITELKCKLVEPVIEEKDGFKMVFKGPIQSIKTFKDIFEKLQGV